MEEGYYQNIRIIAPDKASILKIKKVFGYIVEKSPRQFFNLKSLNSVIVLRGKYDNLLFADLGAYVCQTGTVKESSVSYLASLLIHESRHLFQYKKNKKFRSDEDREEDACRHQRKFLAELGKKREVAWLDEQFKNGWWLFRGKDGERTSRSPMDEKFRKIAEKYSNGRYPS